MGIWREVRCESPSCTTPGGRVLADVHPEGWVFVKRSRQAAMTHGDLAVLICACGWHWRNPAVTGVPALPVLARACQD